MQLTNPDAPTEAIEKQESQDARSIAITRGIVALITIVNLVAQSFGWSPLGVDYETIYAIVSGIAAVIATIWAWWKNNNVTKAAQIAQVKLTETKENKCLTA